MLARSAARHRATGRSLTALDDIAAASAEGMATAGRRSAAAVLTSGLVVSMAGTPSHAAQSTESAWAFGSVDTAALTEPARAALASQVVVPTDVAWTFEAPAVTAVAPPPPPAPAAPAPASRSRERAATAAPADSTVATPAEAPAPAIAVPASANGNAIVEIGMRYVGVPYVAGGTTPDGFDCSGFTSYVFAQVGISLPRTSSAQRNAGTVVSRADAQPGDLIWSPGHISIYIGDNLQIDSPRPGKTIQVREIWQSSPTFIRVG
ncbi:glycoside hydrolase [Cellulomonas sp. Leaf395]|nr:glycoside hydrolase [Cellulomonas sp. Leaf395]